jgi:hypothetical protein
MRGLLLGLAFSLLACGHATDVSVGKQRIARKPQEHPHASGGGMRRHKPNKEFVYVYDMPAKFTTHITQLSPEWHSDQYDYDQVSFISAKVLKENTRTDLAAIPEGAVSLPSLGPHLM